MYDRYNATYTYNAKVIIGSLGEHNSVSLNIYNSTLKVNFIDFIRNEKKFSGIDSLKTQLNKDILKAKQILR